MWASTTPSRSVMAFLSLSASPVFALTMTYAVTMLLASRHRLGTRSAGVADQNLAHVLQHLEVREDGQSVADAERVVGERDAHRLVGLPERQNAGVGRKREFADGVALHRRFVGDGEFHDL